MQARTFTLDPNDVSPDINTDLGFFARSLVIDNTTGQWWYVPTAARWIPPYVTGVVVRFPGGTQAAAIRAQNPGNFGSTPVAGELATAHFSDTEAPRDDSGLLVTPLVPTLTPVSVSAFIDRSGTITLGGTAQVLMVANLVRRYFLCTNLDPVVTLWIRPTGTAAAGQPSIPLNPAPAAGQGGGSFVLDGSAIADQQWSIFSTLTGHAFTAYEL